jgi:hypothetical protein
MSRDVKLVEVPETATGEVRVELELANGRRMIVAGEVTAEMLVELAVAIEAVAQ